MIHYWKCSKVTKSPIQNSSKNVIFQEPVPASSILHPKTFDKKSILLFDPHHPGVRFHLCFLRSSFHRSPNRRWQVAKQALFQGRCKLKTMGRCQKGVHFGAVKMNRGEESSKFPIANFCFFTLFYTRNQNTSRGEIFSNLFVFACTGMLTPSHFLEQNKFQILNPM